MSNEFVPKDERVSSEKLYKEILVETQETYVLAFIDILGQKQELNKLNQDSLSHKETQKIFQKTAGKVLDLRDELNKNFEEFESFIHLEHKQEFKKEILPFNKLQISSLSDLITGFTSLEKRDNPMFLYSLALEGFLLSVGFTFINLLAKDIKVRGAIDIGVAVKVDQNEIYGQPLNWAYHLESNVADYPRILISGRTIKFLQNSYEKLNKELNTKYYKYSQSVAYEDFEPNFNKNYLNEKVSKLIAQDKDGNYILNYLGSAFIKHIKRGKAEQTVINAYKNLQVEFNKHQINSNTKLMSRYEKAIEYFHFALSQSYPELEKQLK
jgi:hypothetical protein